MSNQRTQKTSSKINNDEGQIKISKIIEFAKRAEDVLEETDPESAFYFGQLREWLENNPHIGLNEKCEKILGL